MIKTCLAVLTENH